MSALCAGTGECLHVPALPRDRFSAAVVSVIGVRIRASSNRGFPRAERTAKLMVFHAFILSGFCACSSAPPPRKGAFRLPRRSLAPLTGILFAGLTFCAAPAFAGDTIGGGAGGASYIMSGNVGIGTTSPQAILHVVRPSGNSVAVSSRGLNQDVLNQECDGTHSCNYWGTDYTNAGNMFFGFDTTNKNQLVISSSGNVGIGTWSPAQKLDVNGNISLSNNLYFNGGLPATGSGTLCSSNGGYAGSYVGYCSSDRRLKKDIDYLSGDQGLKAVLGLKPARFKWRNGDGGQKAGFIAQDTMIEIPEAVYRGEGQDYYGFDVAAVVAYSVKALQELFDKWSEDHDALAKLKADNDNFERRLQALEHKPR